MIAIKIKEIQIRTQVINTLYCHVDVDNFKYKL